MTDGAALLWRAELAGIERPTERWNALCEWFESTFPKPMVFVDAHGGLPMPQPAMTKDSRSSSNWSKKPQTKAGYPQEISVFPSAAHSAPSPKGNGVRRYRHWNPSWTTSYA